jgi:imidazolonepropionase-like amidohydrolase
VNGAVETAYVGGTVIDGTGAAPVPDSAVVARDGRISWIGRRGQLPDPGDRGGRQIVDVAGKYVIPGLLDANVHLVYPDTEILLRHEPGEYDDLVVEAAQIALRAGITTVFDTWGPLESLRRVRDGVAAGDVVGSRIFCAGNIIGNNGPLSWDFASSVRSALSPTTVKRVNDHFEQGVGADLTWMSAEDVREAVRNYIATSGIDFVKYSSCVHALFRCIAFSPDAQNAIVEEAHAAGLTAQACAQAPESLKMAIDAGVDLLQHGDVTGLRPMPESTLRLIVDRQLPCVSFLNTARYIALLNERKPVLPNPDTSASPHWGTTLAVQDGNARRLIRAGAKLLLANDMGIQPSGSAHYHEVFADDPDYIRHLGRSHVVWLRAAFERDMRPMDALLSTTRNIAEAYGKADELGSLETGKRADLLILDANPLDAAENYGRVAHVVKDGRLVDRNRLPERPVLTAAA